MPPTMIPFAIDVTDEVPVSGKLWTGPGEPKLVLHTIEGADPWDIGWPRDWTRWSSAPHLAMNSDRFPDGDWLYQTLPFDVAGYAVRDNALEDNHGFYQMETAGRAANTPTYPDSYYEALAVVANWFIENMGMASDVADFSCAEYGTTSPCRWHDVAVDAFSGVLGHCHVGINVDTHSDPGKLDTVRLTSFMDTPVVPPIDPPPDPDPEEPLVDIGRNVEYVREGQKGLDVEYWQVRIIEVIEGTKFHGNSNWSFIAEEAPQLTPTVWDPIMTTYLSAWTGRNSYGVGPTEKVMIENALSVLYN